MELPAIINNAVRLLPKDKDEMLKPLDFIFLMYLLAELSKQSKVIICNCKTHRKRYWSIDDISAQIVVKKQYGSVNLIHTIQGVGLIEPYIIKKKLSFLPISGQLFPIAFRFSQV
jgi:hypothetical protein